MNGQKPKIYEFDNFRLEAAERRFLKDGEPLSLPSKAFDLLLALVENNGHLVEKDTLYNSLWADQFVEDANLTVQMSAIRRALGEGKNNPHYISTVKGHGYRFTADVQALNGDDELIIETESFERIVIERDAETRGQGDAAKKSERLNVSASPRLRVSVSRILIFIALVTTAIGGGYWFYRNRAESAVVPAPEKRQMTITRLTDGRITGAPAVSPDGKFIVFAENQFAGAGTLFLQQIETNTVRQLIEPAERTFGCTEFSPDGALIYFIVFDKRDPDGALYSIPVLGGLPKRIFGKLRSCFALSPDGKRTVFYRSDAENNQTHLVISAFGGEQILFSHISKEWDYGLGLGWSPDGNLIAIAANPKPRNSESGMTLYGVDAGSGAMKPLSHEKFSDIGKIAWTSDGRSLIFVGKRPRIENQIYLMDYPSGEVRRVTNDLESYGNYGLGLTADSDTLVADIFERKAEIWSIDANGDTSKSVRVTSGTTDGQAGIAPLTDGRVAYVARTNKSFEIKLANGAETLALTTDSFTQKDVTASPDGKYLFFASNQTGESRIFRMKADDGSELTQMTFGADADSQPNISPDGNWLVYVSQNGGKSTIWKMPAAGGGAIQLTDYNSGSPVFSPDGRFIACELRSDSRANLGKIAIISADGGEPQKSFQVMPFAYAFQTLQWTPDGGAVVFKKTEKGVSNLWQQPVTGGAPQQLTNFQTDTIWNFAYSTDGKRLFVSRGQHFADVVLIKNFR